MTATIQTETPVRTHPRDLIGVPGLDFAIALISAIRLDGTRVVRKDLAAVLCAAAEEFSRLSPEFGVTARFAFVTDSFGIHCREMVDVIEHLYLTGMIAPLGEGMAYITVDEDNAALRLSLVPGSGVFHRLVPKAMA